MLRVLLPLVVLAGFSSQCAQAAYQFHVPLKGLVVTSANPLTLSLADAALPEAIVGSPYAPYDFKSLVSVGGNGAPSPTAVTWSVLGSLPAGLSLSATGVLSGTPSVKNETGTPIEVKAAYLNAFGQHAYWLRILDPQVSLSSSALPAARVGQAYTFDFKSRLGVTGDPNFNPSLASFSRSGTLPEGLTLGADGVVSGTPTAVDTGDTSFQVIATYKTRTGQQAYTIVVNGAVLQVTQIAAGNNYTCAVTTSGAATCWGENTYGKLGDGTTTTRNTPVTVSGLASGVASIAIGENHACAVTTSGVAKCWGYNAYGQLGDGTTTLHYTPVEVSGLSSGTASISAGVLHTCAVTTAGAAKCWGYNGSGRLGDGTTTQRLTPVEVSGLSRDVVRIAAGSNYACAVTTAGAAKCWGANTLGQLGDGTNTKRTAPVQVSGLSSGVASISAGSIHTCAVTTAGAAKCWGYNGSGQLGDGTTTTRYTPLSALSSDVAGISAGSDYTCAVTAAGGAKCWGNNSYGKLGDGTTTHRASPVNVSGLTSGVVSISASYAHTCAVSSSGAKCWGDNVHGKLGDGTTTTRYTPVEVLPP